MDMGKTIKVTYSSGEWCGNLVRDMVGFGVFNMEMSYFSLITTSTDFFIEGAEWVGILGMAYESLAKVWSCFESKLIEYKTHTNRVWQGKHWMGFKLMATAISWGMLQLRRCFSKIIQPDSSVGTVWDTIRPANTMQDVFSLQLCPPKESTLFPGTFIKQGGYMVSLHGNARPFHLFSNVYLLNCNTCTLQTCGGLGDCD